MRRKPARGAPPLERGAADVVSELLWDDLRMFLSCASSGSLTRPADVEAIQRALERAGVEFIDVGAQPGVRLRK